MYVKLKVDLFIFLFTKAAMIFLSIITSVSSKKLCECLCMCMYMMYVFPLKKIHQRMITYFQRTKKEIRLFGEMK